MELLLGFIVRERIACAIKGTLAVRATTTTKHIESGMSRAYLVLTQGDKSGQMQLCPTAYGTLRLNTNILTDIPRFQYRIELLADNALGSMASFTHRCHRYAS